MKALPKKEIELPGEAQLRRATLNGILHGTRLDMLFERPTKCVARLHLETGSSVIVKLWARPGLRGILRRMTHTGNLHREWWALTKLHHCGIPVPAPLLKLRFQERPRGYTEGMLCEDLGECQRANLRLEQLVAAGESTAAFDREIVEMTGAVLAAGIMDVDNHLNNFVYLENGSLARIDLELARRPWAVNTPQELGELLGAMICTYLLSVQPHTELADSFCDMLLAEVKPSAKVRQLTSEVVTRKLETQRRAISIDTRWGRSW